MQIHLAFLEFPSRLNLPPDSLYSFTAFGAFRFLR